jgi:outer membrane lipoprotein SlyB
MTILRKLVVAGVLSGGLAACATAPGAYDYAPYETGAAARVEDGVIVSSRPITIGGSKPGSGAVIGGLAGAGVGAQFGGDTGGHLLGAVIGALGGAAIGDAVQTGQTRQGVAYIVRRDYDGASFEVAQPDAEPLPPGARVHIVYGERVRITPAS